MNPYEQKLLCLLYNKKYIKWYTYCNSSANIQNCWCKCHHYWITNWLVTLRIDKKDKQIITVKAFTTLHTNFYFYNELLLTAPKQFLVLRPFVHFPHYNFSSHNLFSKTRVDVAAQVIMQLFIPLIHGNAKKRSDAVNTIRLIRC